MKQRKLGKNGPVVSAVGYGSMSLTDFYGPTSDENSLKILDACVELGITHIDTADAYGMGRSETLIGKWLKTRCGEADMTIATKVGDHTKSGTAIQQYARAPSPVAGCKSSAAGRRGD